MPATDRRVQASITSSAPTKSQDLRQQKSGREDREADPLRGQTLQHGRSAGSKVSPDFEIPLSILGMKVVADPNFP
jgi:hypothetical protein